MPDAMIYIIEKRRRETTVGLGLLFLFFLLSYEPFGLHCLLKLSTRESYGSRALYVKFFTVAPSEIMMEGRRATKSPWWLWW